MYSSVQNAPLERSFSLPVIDFLTLYIFAFASKVAFECKQQDEWRDQTKTIRSPGLLNEMCISALFMMI